jgi:hypothetical protein
MPSDEKEVTMTSVATTEGTRKKRRPRRNKTTRSLGEAIVTKEEVVITKKPNETPKGIKVESQQVFKLVPKSESVVKKSALAPAPAPVSLPAPPAPIPTKITILPKKRVQKITILGKTVKKPVSDVKEKSVPVSAPVKQKIVLPITAKKTRKQYKERKLRIDV